MSLGYEGVYIESLDGNAHSAHWRPEIKASGGLGSALEAHWMRTESALHLPSLRSPHPFRPAAEERANEQHECPRCPRRSASLGGRLTGVAVHC
jgi:hypothetical protein